MEPTPEEDEKTIFDKIKVQYPFVQLFGYEDESQIFITSLKVPEEHRRKGIGRDIISWIKDYAYDVQKPVVLTPAAEYGYKAKLDKFYKNLGFIHNKGKKMDYTLSKTFAPTMYWRPRRKFVEYVVERDLDLFGELLY